MFNGSCGADFRPNNEHELVESTGCSNNTFSAALSLPVRLCGCGCAQTNERLRKQCILV